MTRKIMPSFRLYDIAGMRSHKPQISQAFEERTIVNKRYEIENRFMEAVAEGKTTEAINLFREMNALAPGQSFHSGAISNQIAGAAIIRTLIRRAAIQGGLTPVLIDAISQAYAQEVPLASDGAIINAF